MYDFTLVVFGDKLELETDTPFKIIYYDGNLKNIIDNDYNKDNNYDDILRRIEGNNSMKKYGYILTFACFVIVIGAIVFNNFAE